MLLGSSIDPSLFSNDYSGFANAGAIRGQATAQLGKDIGGAITAGAQGYQQMKQMQGQTDAFGKSMDAMAKAFPSQAEMFSTAKMEVLDPNASLIERMSRMSTFSNQFSLMNQMQSQENANKLLALKLGAAETKATGPTWDSTLLNTPAQQTGAPQSQSKSPLYKNFYGV